MQNDMRDRLVELLSIIPCNAESCSAVCDGRCQEFDDLDRCQIGQLADHLIANGVILPPCKIGDTVYYVHETYWDKDYKKYISTKYLKENILQIFERPDDETNLMLEIISFDYSDIGDWLNGRIFLTKEEAEQKLKEMRVDNDL